MSTPDTMMLSSLEDILVTSFLVVRPNFTAKFLKEGRERGRQMREGRKDKRISANKSPYLRNGAR